MHIDPLLPYLAGLALVILLLGQLLKRFRQPFVVAYLLVGVALGPHGLGVITDAALLNHLGSIGVVLLLFFVGLEVSLPDLATRWRIAIGGTGLQILISVGAAALLGRAVGWTWAKTVLIGFIIALSSTAVVLKILRDWGEQHTPVGRNVTAVLLTQDLALIPMVILLGALSGDTPSLSLLVRQLGGGAAILALVIWIACRGPLALPFSKGLQQDHESQVYAALTICFGVAFVTGGLGLSTALGAFVGGVVLGAARDVEWIHDSLRPFQVVFLGLFFVSVGMLIDLQFIADHAGRIAVLVGLTLAINLFINSGIFVLLGESWRDSLYAGALLSQIGEFSFVLAGLGLQAGILLQQGYQTTVSVIALSLLISPFWIGLFKHWTGQNRGRPMPV